MPPINTPTCSEPMHGGGGGPGAKERSDEAPRAAAVRAQPTPDPQVVAKPSRRRFTAEYRLRVLEFSLVGVSHRF